LVPPGAHRTGETSTKTGRKKNQTRECQRRIPTHAGNDEEEEDRRKAADTPAADRTDDDDGHHHDDESNADGKRLLEKDPGILLLL
jgi:hypothetical protein